MGPQRVRQDWATELTDWTESSVLGLVHSHFLEASSQNCGSLYHGYPGGSEVKASACNAGDLGSITGSGRSPGEGNGNPLQYSCLENPRDGGAWWATVHGVAESDRTERLHFHFQLGNKRVIQGSLIRRGAGKYEQTDRKWHKRFIQWDSGNQDKNGRVRGFLINFYWSIIALYMVSQVAEW